MTKSKDVTLTDSDLIRVSRGLGELTCVCELLERMISDGADEQILAIHALVQRSGARIESTLINAGMPAFFCVSGTAEHWLGLECNTGEQP
jgi:hypothetical protein